MATQFHLNARPISDDQYDELFELVALVFGPGDRLDGTWRIRNMPDFTYFEARRETLLVGFKLGYAVTSHRYYSWLGGVHPKHRKKGIALALMQQQHRWIANNNFSVVETEVRSANAAMIALNEASGFVCVGNKLAGDSPVSIYRKLFE